MSPMEVPALSADAKQRLEDVLTRAANDIEFRNRLLADPTAALSNSGLGADEITVLSSMRRVALEEWGVDVRRYRAFLRDNGTKVTHQ